MALILAGGGLSLDLNVTFILVLAILLIPLIVLNTIVFKPFLKVFEARHEQLEGAIERANQMLDDAEAQAKTFETKIQSATAKGTEARNAIRTDATTMMNARIEEERKKLAARVEVELSGLEKKRREALADVHVQAEAIAQLCAEKLLGRQV